MKRLEGLTSGWMHVKKTKSYPFRLHDWACGLTPEGVYPLAYDFLYPKEIRKKKKGERKRYFLD